MFKAIFRFFRAIKYMLTGQIDKATAGVASDPNVIRAQFAEILQTKKGQIQEYSGAVATLLAQQEKKKQTMKRLTEECKVLSKRKAGAGGKAKELAAALRTAGKSMEAIKADGDFLKHQAAFNDFTATLEEKLARIEEVENDIENYVGRINKHKIGLQRLQRDIMKLKEEGADTIADIITAKEEKQMNDALTGISEDGTGADLERIRNMRDQAKAEAAISSELAGTDVSVAAAEYEQFSMATEANEEFDALIGFEDTDTKLEKLEGRLDKSKATAEE